MIDISHEWDEEANGWVSETLCLNSDIFLVVKFAEKGRVVVKKAEQEEGPYPKVFIAKKSAKDFTIRVVGTTENRYIKIITSIEPTLLQYASIPKRFAHRRISSVSRSG